MQTSLFETLKTKYTDISLARQIRNLDPTWGCADGYFCRSPKENFLCGFAANHKSFGTEVNIFTLPLYVQEFAFHLGFSDPLRGSGGEVITLSRSPRKAFGAHFLGVIAESIDELDRLDSLGNLISMVEEHKLASNPRYQFVYGLTLILIGEFDLAQSDLKAVATDRWTNEFVPSEANTAKELLIDLETDNRQALKKVLTWRDSNLQAFQI